MNTLLQNKWNMEAPSRAESESLTAHSKHYRSWKRSCQFAVCWDSTVQEVHCSLFPKEHHTKTHSILWLGCNTWTAPPNSTLLVSHTHQCIISDDCQKVKTNYSAILLYSYFTIKLVFSWRAQQWDVLSPAASTAVPITAPNKQNKFPIKNLLKAFLANLSYPSGLPHEEEDGKTQRKASRTRDVLPFPCDQPPTVLPKHSPDATHVVPLPPAALLLTQNPTETAGNAAGKATHSPVDCAVLALPRLQPVQAMSWDNLAQPFCSSCARDSSEGTQPGTACPWEGKKWYTRWLFSHLLLAIFPKNCVR